MSKDRFIVLISSLHETSLFSPQHFVRSIGELPRGEGPETELGQKSRVTLSRYCISQNLIKNQQENQGQVPKLKYPQKQKWPGNEY